MKVPISGQNRPNAYHDFKAGAEEGEFTGAHYYWCHLNDPDTLVTNNNSMLKDIDPFGKPRIFQEPLPGNCGIWKVKDKPFVVDEWNVLATANDFRSEIMTTMAGYAGLHDWDALTHFTLFADQTNWDEPKERTLRGSPFDPARIGLFPACSLMFLRHDVATSKKVIEFRNTADAYENPLKDKGAGNYFYTMDRSRIMYAGYLCRMETVFEKPETTKADASVGVGSSGEEIFQLLVAKGIAPADIKKTLAFTSDTGELTTNLKKGILSINTAKSQGAAGFLNESGSVELENMAIDKTSTFATVILSSLDDKPIAASKRMLLTVVGDADWGGEKRKMISNTASKEAAPEKGSHPKQYVNQKPWDRLSSVTGPVLVEPVETEITLKRTVPDGSLTVYALDAGGERKVELPTVAKEKAIIFKPSGGQYKTIYYEIVVK